MTPKHYTWNQFLHWLRRNKTAEFRYGHPYASSSGPSCVMLAFFRHKHPNVVAVSYEGEQAFSDELGLRLVATIDLPFPLKQFGGHTSGQEILDTIKTLT